MNKEDLLKSAADHRKRAELFEAAAEGKTVQHRDPLSGWCDVLAANAGYIISHVESDRLRLKPAPAMRTIRAEELPQQPFFVRLCGSTLKFATTGVGPTGLWLGDKAWTYQQLRDENAEYHDPRDGQWKRFEVKEEA